MTYCVRYRFKVLAAPELPDGEALTLTIPGLPPATLEVGQDAWPMGKWAVLKARGFQTESEALLAGQRLGDTLLIVGAVTSLGVDIGFNRPTLHFNAQFHADVAARTGKELRTDTHGLMVYEEGQVTIVGLSAQGSLLLSPGALEQRLRDWISTTSSLTDRQRNCASLLNDAFFVPQTEGQFILRISAVEALCDQRDVGAEYQAAVMVLETFLATQALTSDIRETISRSLARQKKQSLRQSYMAKFRSLLTDADARAFDALYQKRSKLVHEGQGRGALTQAVNDALNLAVALLAADLRSGNEAGS